ncbi:MAG: alpha/beta hydrolase [Cyclobacteriaceae bacterium]|nr:alpha/beta hydrolase [Cyclobacteriaceae bacterium]
MLYDSESKIKCIAFFIGVFVCLNTYSQTSKPIIYLIPGQGADERLFSKLTFDKNAYSIKHIKYHTPEKNTTLKSYALQLSKQIDTTEAFILVGVSLGGMIATELIDFLSPEKVIIISSAKSKKELPFRYRIQKVMPIYKLLSSRAIKRGAFIMQPIVEPDRNVEEEIFKSMLTDKNKHFMKRSVQMIIQWNRTIYSSDIIHIHGDKDNTIPIRNINYDYAVIDGSHMMTLTRPEIISKILNKALNR